MSQIRSIATTDEILLELGQRLQRYRLQQNRTAAAVAREAGIGLRTLERAEAGERPTLATFIQILRALGRLDTLETFLPAPLISPIQLAELSGRNVAVRARRGSGTVPKTSVADHDRLLARAASRVASSYTVARIHLWGRDVGAVAEDHLGQVTFEYSEAFRQSGLEISPIHLPLSQRGPQIFPALQRVESFAGLPGVLADCLPDAFGNAVIRRYFEQRGTPNAAMSPVQKLLYIGSRAMGALEFSPPLEGRSSRDADEALAIAQLVEAARRVIEGDPDVAVPEMMRVGASAGGARAKALILWNQHAGRVRSAFAPTHAGDEPWLIKFDGVTSDVGGHGMTKAFVPGPYGRIEYAYSMMASAAGIDMAETHLLHERDFAHFLTKRFDRDGATRLHLHSLGGLHHADYNVRQVLSYEDYFRTVRMLGMGQPAVDQAFRRMVFNMAVRNQDDHVKNMAFLMDSNGHWRLAPAFDLTWANGGKWAGTHQMTARRKDDAFTRDDLLALGSMFDVQNGGADILTDVEAALGVWQPEATSAGLDREWIDRIQEQFRHFA